jgi:hypothetical protein
MTVSCGVATFPYGGPSVSALRVCVWNPGAESLQSESMRLCPFAVDGRAVGNVLHHGNGCERVGGFGRNGFRDVAEYGCREKRLLTENG